MNIKRKHDNQSFELGRFKYTKRHLINIEKIIKKSIELNDYYVCIGKVGWNGILPYNPIEIERVKNLKLKKPIRYFRMYAKPYLVLEITPLHSKISINRVYIKGSKLDELDKTVKQISNYIQANINKSTLNIIV